MSDLFRKLNVLLKASIKDVLGDNPLQRPIKSRKLGKNLQSEVQMLRGRINDAIAHEDTLQTKMDSLQSKIVELDAQADQAVDAGNDAQARYLIGQLQRMQQHLAMAESDLREHQLVTQELIQKVNMLDAVVADVQNQQVEQESAPNVEDKEVAESEGKLTNALKHVRETINTIGDNITTVAQGEHKNNEEPSSNEATPSSDDEREINNDLDSRRQRLSKPK